CSSPGRVTAAINLSSFATAAETATSMAMFRLHRRGQRNGRSAAILSRGKELEVQASLRCPPRRKADSGETKKGKLRVGREGRAVVGKQGESEGERTDTAVDGAHATVA